LLSKGQPGWFGLTMHVGVGQLHLAVHQRRQVVVGHQHRQAVRARMRHAVEAGDAVVHRDQQVRAALAVRQRQIHDGGREAVAVDRAVGYHVAHAARRGAQHRQAAQGHGAGGGAVAVVVGHDADALPRIDRVGQQAGGVVDALERGRRQQPRQAVVEFVRAPDAARGEQACQQRMHAGTFEGMGSARGHVAGVDQQVGHRGASRWCTEGAG
jgi:hypothetical protein